MNYIYRGQIKTTDNLALELENMEKTLANDLGGTSLPLRKVINALDKLSAVLKSDKDFLVKELIEYGMTQDEAQGAKIGASNILDKDELYTKVNRELFETPLEICRRESTDEQLEGYLSLGVLGHVTSSNSPILPFLSAVEGLLTGNINIIKTSRKGSDITIKLAQKLCSICSELSPYMYVLPISSKDEENLKLMFNCCDGIAVWGSEAAVEGVAQLAPQGIRIINWGHRISFSYITKLGNTKEALLGVAQDVVINEQQACSAPQVVYFETDSKEELLVFAKDLFNALKEVSSKKPLHNMTNEEVAEITMHTEIAKLKEIMGDGACLDGGDFRIYVEYDNELISSPLFRTVILKPIKRKDIIIALRPFRSYLQTVGLSCDTTEITDLTNKFVRAGVTRITSTGKMVNGYTGEPHDGVYALSRYVKRVSVSSDVIPKSVMEFNELNVDIEAPFEKDTPIMKKVDFHNEKSKKSKEGLLIIKSGGSSGKAIYAPHTYNDANMTYKTAARAIIAAGVDPKSDICMNLFYSGNLYGGFISMYEALKIANVTQLPMAVCKDLDFVVKEIITNNVNVLIGMPSYLNELFSEKEKELKAYGKIEKVLYAGEHFNPVQIENLKENFGVKSIKSLIYGCNEIGSIGYVCEHCSGSQHHLFSSKYMEILKLDSDEPVEGEEIGRIILTPVDQENTTVMRYEIGDIGRYILKPCECGRLAPKFELLGRYGDSFKFSTNFLNAQRIKNILSEKLNYTGWIQILLENDSRENMTIKVLEDLPNAVEVLSDNYSDIKMCLTFNTATIKCVKCNKDEFVLSSGGGKVCLILDKRM